MFIARLVFLAATPWLPPAQGQARLSPAYLSEMPTVQRVTAEIQGIDPMDTAARQMGAFWQLQQVIKDLAGPRVYRNQLTSDEGRLLGLYAYGYQTAGQPYASHPDKTKWYQMHSFYESDDGFLLELLQRFFSPAFSAEYSRVRGARDARWLERSRAAAAARAQSQAQSAGQSSSGGAVATSQPGAPAKSGAALPPKAPASSPANVQTDEGFKLLEAKDYGKALEAFQKAIALDASLARARRGVALVYHAQKQWSLALTAWKQAVALDPNKGIAFDGLGLAYFNLEEFEDAASAFQKATQLEPGQATYHYDLGLSYVELGKREEALQVHRTLQKIDPAKARQLFEEIDVAYLKEDDPDALIIMGLDLNYRELYVDALRAFRRAIALHPSTKVLATAHAGVGRVYIDQKKYEKAMAPLREALRLNPADSDAHYQMGRAYNRLEQYAKAVGALRESIRLKADDPDAHGALGLAYYRLNQFPNAAAEFQEAIRLSPGFIMAHYNLGYTFISMGRKNEALRVQRTLQGLDKKLAQELLNDINKMK